MESFTIAVEHNWQWNNENTNNQNATVPKYGYKSARQIYPWEDIIVFLLLVSYSMNYWLNVFFNIVKTSIRKIESSLLKIS